MPGAVGWADWALGRRGLSYATARQQEFTIQYPDFSSGKTTLLLRRVGVLGHWTLAVSHDEQWVLFGESPAWQSELMLMEKFR